MQAIKKLEGERDAARAAAKAGDGKWVEQVDAPPCDDVSDSVLWSIGLVFNLLAAGAEVVGQPWNISEMMPCFLHFRVSRPAT